MALKTAPYCLMIILRFIPFPVFHPLQQAHQVFVPPKMFQLIPQPAFPGSPLTNGMLEPASAGNITNSGLTAFVVWTSGFLGDANVKVAGENVCGTGIYSEPITTTRYLPEVSFEPLDWVCLDWPAFELTGGWPEGGEYSGPGVDNGWFNPSVAGIGTHTITYTYTDLNNCENFADETILVDPCTGVNDITGQSGIKIYPNPTNGKY